MIFWFSEYGHKAQLSYPQQGKHLKMDMILSRNNGDGLKAPIPQKNSSTWKMSCSCSAGATLQTPLPLIPQLWPEVWMNEHQAQRHCLRGALCLFRADLGEKHLLGHQEQWLVVSGQSPPWPNCPLRLCKASRCHPSVANRWAQAGDFFYWGRTSWLDSCWGGWDDIRRGFKSHLLWSMGGLLPPSVIPLHSLTHSNRIPAPLVGWTRLPALGDVVPWAVPVENYMGFAIFGRLFFH